MKPYFLNIGTGKVHSTIRVTGTCKCQLHSENYREFDSLEEIKQLAEKYVSYCKICMKEEKEYWNKVFGIEKGSPV